MDSFDIVVIATLESEPTAPDETRLPRANFRICHYLRGKEIFPDASEEGQVFESVVVSRKHQIGEQFLVMGAGTRTINWSTPMRVSDRVIEYLKHLETLPEKGVDRLAFFAGHFEDEEPVLANDAYDEFARASYAEVVEIGPRLDRDKLIGWLENPEVIKPRKRLYYTLLGVCGTDKEIPYLEEIIRSGDRDRQSGLDALIACYLTLRGDEGVALIEETFLTNPKAEYIDVFSAITRASLSRNRIGQGFPRTHRFSVEARFGPAKNGRHGDSGPCPLGRLERGRSPCETFREANTDDTKWVRTPIISYLQACPLPAAAEHITALREIDPEAVQRAEMLADIDWADDEPEDDSGEMTEDPAATEDNSKPDDANETGGKKDGDKKDENPAAEDGGKGGIEIQTTDGTPVGGPFVDLDSAISPESIVVMKPVFPMVSADETGETTLDPNDENSGFSQNRDPASYVSTYGTRDIPIDDRSARGPEQLAQSAQPTPPVAAVPPSSPSTAIMLITAAGSCVLLFALLWSVLNGRFQRLIF